MRTVMKYTLFNNYPKIQTCIVMKYILYSTIIQRSRCVLWWNIYSIQQLSKDPDVYSIRQKSIQHAAIYKNEPYAFVKSIWVVDDVIMMTSSWTNQRGLSLVHAPTCPPSWIIKGRFLMTSSSNRYTHKTFNSDDIIMNQSAWHL